MDTSSQIAETDLGESETTQSDLDPQGDPYQQNEFLGKNQTGSTPYDYKNPPFDYKNPQYDFKNPQFDFKNPQYDFKNPQYDLDNPQYKNQQYDSSKNQQYENQQYNFKNQLYENRQYDLKNQQYENRQYDFKNQQFDFKNQQYDFKQSDSKYQEFDPKNHIFEPNGNFLPRKISVQNKGDVFVSNLGNLRMSETHLKSNLDDLGMSTCSSVWGDDRDLLSTSGSEWEVPSTQILEQLSNSGCKGSHRSEVQLRWDDFR